MLGVAQIRARLDQISIWKLFLDTLLSAPCSLVSILVSVFNKIDSSCQSLYSAFCPWWATTPSPSRYTRWTSWPRLTGAGGQGTKKWAKVEARNRRRYNKQDWEISEIWKLNRVKLTCEVVISLYSSVLCLCFSKCSCQQLWYIFMKTMIKRNFFCEWFWTEFPFSCFHRLQGCRGTKQRRLSESGSDVDWEFLLVRGGGSWNETRSCCGFCSLLFFGHAGLCPAHGGGRRTLRAPGHRNRVEVGNV